MKMEMCRKRGGFEDVRNDINTFSIQRLLINPTCLRCNKLPFAWVKELCTVAQMSTRALARAGLHPTPHIDLPVGLRPQIVNAEGYQVAEDELEGDVVAETTNDGVDGAGGDVPVSGVAMVEEQDADDHEEGEPETPEQLISLAERCV